MKEIKEFYNNSTLIEKRFILGFSLIAIMLSVSCFFYFMSNKIYFIGSDAYAYMSMADSLRENGKLLDITTVTPTPPKTPQNGIVLVHLILSYFGLSQYQRLVSIVLINYITYLSAIYPLFKISSGLGLQDNKFAMMSLIGAHLGAWHIYRFELLAINDGVFYTSSIWLTYLIVSFLNRYYKGGGNVSITQNRYLLLSIFSLALFSILFRINTIFIMFSMVLTVLIFDTINKKYKISILITVASFSVLGIFLLIYQSTDLTLINVYLGNVINGWPGLFDLSNLYELIKRLVLDTMPRIAARPIFYGKSNIIYTVFLLPPFITLVKTYKENRPGEMFISLQCIVIFIIGTLVLNDARYIIHIYPMLYLMIFSIPKTRLIGHLFVFLVFSSTVRTVSREWVRGPGTDLWLYIYEQSIIIPTDDILLLTGHWRHAYFFLNTRSYGSPIIKKNGNVKIPERLSWNLIKQKGSLFVLGDSTYINSAYSQVGKMVVSNGYELKINSITPDLDKFEGWALVKFQIEDN